MDRIPLPLLLDGATGSELLRRGMPAGACTEAWVLEHPEALKELQRAYVDAGAGAVLAPTFGANAVRLEEQGLTGKVEEYNRRLVALSRDAVGGRALVAGDLGPTGKSIPPFGAFSFEMLEAVYMEQAAALERAGVDFFVIETMVSMPEARAALLAVRSVSDKPAVVTFTCDENGRTPSGTDVLAALIVMQGMGAAAFGLNCCGGPEAVAEQLRRLTPYATIPLAAKPSAGMPEHGPDGLRYPCLPEDFARWVPEFAAAGARIFGGCCGAGPEHLAALANAVKKVDFSAFPPVERDPDVIPCASETEARFITPDVDVGEEIACSSDLMEDILEAEEEFPQGALKIEIMEEDDLALFAENQYVIKDPLCISTDVPELLEGALRAFQGRAFWDGTEELDSAFLERMRDRYGLILL